MERSGIALILLSFSLPLFAGCTLSCEMIGPGCSDQFSTIRVSRDPQACKSIMVDCSGYGDNGYYDRVDSILYYPFPDSSGCGCRAHLNNG